MATSDINDGSQLVTDESQQLITEGRKRIASSPPEATPRGKKKVAQEMRQLPETDNLEKETGAETEWKEVGRRGEKKNKKKMKEGEGATKRQIKRRLPEAVAVKINNEMSYANVLRQLKTKVDPDKMGLQVSGIRKTRAGEILIELKNGSGKAEELRTNVAAALGDGATVRTLDRTVSLVVKDLDGATEEAEVVSAISAVVEKPEADAIKVRALRKGFGETQVAVVTMSSRGAAAVLKAGRLRIGWVMCRVREKIEVARCFRCLGFGHIARDCKGEDRTNMCRLCGTIGHRAKDCKQEPCCVICNDSKQTGGAKHIIGSARCESFRKEREKTRR